jgi:hypothetical protein
MTLPRGVYKHGRKYRAKANGVHLGIFATVAEASKAYEEARTNPSPVLGRPRRVVLPEGTDVETLALRHRIKTATANLKERLVEANKRARRWKYRYYAARDKEAPQLDPILMEREMAQQEAATYKEILVALVEGREAVPQIRDRARMVLERFND